MTTEPATTASGMRGWPAALPADRLLVDVSLWSGDLTALGAEVDRISPIADVLHFDVTDGTFGSELMFSPAMIAAVRPRTAVPFHAHVAAYRPAALIDAVAAAGADLITVQVEADDAVRALRRIREHRKAAGLALGVDTRAIAARPHLDAVDALVLVGTPGAASETQLTLAALRRVEAARSLLEATGHQGTVRLLAEGGVRGRTIRSLSAAGVDGLVTDLPVRSPDPAATGQWLHSHSRPSPAR